MLSKQKHSTWSFEKINICFAVNALLELLNDWVYTAYEKEAVAPRFSTEIKFTYDESLFS